MSLSLTDAECRLINAYQHGLPLEPRPYRRMAENLGLSETEVIDLLEGLKAKGVLSRVGAVVTPNRTGASALAAMEVPPERLEQVAAVVTAMEEINHNYEREHALNLWFVVTAADEEARREVLADIAEKTGIDVLEMPLIEAYHIDLGFPVS